MAAVALNEAPRTAGDSRSFVGIFVTGFLVFLAIAVVAQSLGMPWRSWFPGAEGEKSLLRGVTATVYTFMGHLS
jgi:light-harvesting complex 1 beta chain